MLILKMEKLALRLVMNLAIELENSRVWIQIPIFPLI